MIGTKTYKGTKIVKGSDTLVSDPLTVEQPLEISINNVPFTVVMQTPGDEEELARGLLFAEDVIDKKIQVKFDKALNEIGFVEKININIDPSHIGDGYKNSRSLVSLSSCGICGKQSLEDLEIATGTVSTNKQYWSVPHLFEMQERFTEAQLKFKRTGGCHGVGGFDKEGNLITVKEDIGRHNALDKVIGHAIEQKRLKELKIIMFSGRVSYEIVTKAFRANIPVIMAVSAPSSLAVDFANEFGITLLAFARNNTVTCYSHAYRISSK